MNCDFVLNEFEGPLDLLLHLIKKDNIDIYDINLSELTNQYLEYIRSMENMNLDIASEYLVMAAELIEMKSKALLPKSEFDTEDDYEEDPREQLIKRLVNYQNYKELSTKLKDLEENRSEIYTKIPQNLTEYIDKKELLNKYNISIDDLVKAMDQFVVRKDMEKPLSTVITNKEISVAEKSKEIKDILKSKKQVSFYELFNVNTKIEIIVTFLAILELARKKHIILSQENNFENIIIKSSEV
ncbi:MAG: segregation/condensation protein A [Bacilli bacterium]|nr:segregation/condensation protein A [Bacilli bacterium]